MEYIEILDQMSSTKSLLKKSGWRIKGGDLADGFLINFPMYWITRMMTGIYFPSPIDSISIEGVMVIFLYSP